jgi:hypothetical protein
LDWLRQGPLAPIFTDEMEYQTTETAKQVLDIVSVAILGRDLAMFGKPFWV